MKKASPLLLLLLALAACSDSSGPEPVARVSISLGATPTEQATLQVGSTLQLSAAALNQAGTPLAGRRVTWRSTAPAVAGVDSTGLVSALAPGSALVIATSEAAADTVSVTVTPPPSSGLACAAGDQGLSLAVGEVRTFAAAQAPILCVAGGDGSEYTLIPFYASESGSRTLQVEVAADAVTSVSGPPNPSLLPGSAARGLLSAGAAARDPLHERLRLSEAALFPALRRAARRPSGARLSRSAVEPRVGDLLALNTNADDACDDPTFRTGRVEAVTRHAVIVADTVNPTGGFARAEYEELGRAFDEQVYPVNVANFGQPIDIDENQRVLIFFTESVNRMTEEGSNSIVGGFFYGRDFFERGGVDPCAGSNQAEIFYMLVPDPARAQRESPQDPEVSPFSKTSVRQGTVSVLAHEFQHLINLSRRVELNADDSEDVWLNEGLSHIAEELVFYAVGRAAPRQNFTVDRIRSSSDLVASYNEFMADNIGRYRRYLNTPEGQSPIQDDDDLETRGSSWSFLRYAADRRAGNDQQLWLSLVNTRLTGMANLRAALGADPLPWLQDWGVSVYTDDAVSTPAQYQQPSWNFRQIFGFFSQGTSNPPYPLAVRTLRSGTASATRVTVAGGGSAFLRFGVAAGARSAVRAGVRGTGTEVTFPSTLRVALVRTR